MTNHTTNNTENRQRINTNHDIFNMDKRPDIPRLDSTNYGPCIVATRAAAHTIDAIEHITSNPNPPQDKTDLTTFQRNKNYLLGSTWAVNHVNPPQIANLILTTTSDPTPYDLIQAVMSHLDTTNVSDHKYLKQLAEQAHYFPDMTLEQYISTHEQIRTRMIGARYYEILDPKHTCGIIPLRPELSERRGVSEGARDADARRE